VELTAVHFVGHSANVMCRVTADVDGRGGDFALRICDPDRTTPQLEAECAWMSAIAEETSVRCAAPLTTVDGAHVAELPVRELDAHRRCILFPWVDGAQVEEPRPEHLRRLGETTAALHNHADGYSRGTPVDRPNADWPAMFDRFLRGDVTAAWEDHPGPAMTDEESAVFADAAARVQDEIEAVATDANHGLIHADLHLWNVVYADGEPWPIDFDDCHYAHYMTDAATPLFHLPRSDREQELADAYFAGYETTRPLPADWRQQVATFRAARCFSLADWILSWRREDHEGSGSEALAAFTQQLRAYLRMPS
jgi:Ser/Thr protein kinase RdoA (MazF antagonist)